MLNLDIVSFFSGVAATLLGKILYDRLKIPKLNAWQREKDPDIQEGVDSRGKSFRLAFYHIAISNERKRFGVMVNPAHNARAVMTFYKDGEEKFRIPAKWDFRPEPFKYTEKEGELIPLPDPSLIPQAELLDINPGSEETFCICMKYEGEEKIYGFNAFSYLYNGLRNPKWKLERGEYHVHIAVTAANTFKEFDFTLRNEGRNFEDVKIIKIK